jgi:hypothetical protein
MGFFNRQQPENEIKRQEELIMAEGQATDEWLRLTISKKIINSLDQAEEKLKEGLFEFDSKEYYRAQGTLAFIKSLRCIIETPLAERDLLVASKKGGTDE